MYFRLRYSPHISY